MRSFISGLPVLLVAAAAVAEEVAADLFAGAVELDPAALVEAVLARNPTLAAAAHAARAAEQESVRARGLEALRISYGLAPASVGAADVDFGQEVRASQMLPFRGKRRLRGEVAEAEAEAARLDVATVRLDLAARAAERFADYYLVDRALAVNAEHVDLLEEFQRVATARYAAGLAVQQDPLQAEVELAHVLHDGRILESERAVLVAEINALLHRAPEAPLPPPPAERPAAIGETHEIAEAELEEVALAARPELAAADAAIRALETEVELAQLERRPDFGVMASYNSMWSDSEHRVMIGGEIALPRRRPAVAAAAQAEASAVAAVAERQALVDEIRRELRSASERLAEGHHILELYESRLLPAAHDQVAAALAGFTSGGTDFLAVIEAERNLRTFELGYHETLANLYRYRAELDRAVGRMPPEPMSREPADVSSPEEGPGGAS